MIRKGKIGTERDVLVHDERNISGSFWYDPFFLEILFCEEMAVPDVSVTPSIGRLYGMRDRIERTNF